MHFFTRKVGLTKRIIAGLTIGMSMGALAQVPSSYQVGRWYKFKTAAVTYTFDDNCSNQIPVALPLFDNYSFKTTFFTVTTSGAGFAPNWNSLKTISANGHEVASHTVSHTSLNTLSVSSQDTELKNSQSTIVSNVPTSKCQTVAYPNCNTGDINTIQKYYIAGRTCSGQIISSSPTDFYNLSSIICGNTGVNTANDMNSKITSAKSSTGWCVFLIHGIDNDNGYSPLASSVLSSHLSYVNTNTADYWVGTFANVVKYIKERNALSFTEMTVTADSLRITPTDNLDNATYDAAVTIRRQLPSTWSDARVYLGTTLQTSTIVTVNNVKYIQFDVIPDKGTYSISNKNSSTCATPAPTVTATVSYELGQTATALTATGTALKWYTVATGGTASSTAPTPSTTTVGSTIYYVSQTLNGCEGPRASITVTVSNTYKIYKVSTAPTIDGAVDDIWNHTSVSPISASKTLSGTISSANDLSGTAKYLWDNTYVYVLAKVTDDTKQNDSQNAYDDDAVEFYFDINNEKATSYDANDVQYTFAWNDGTVVGALPSGRSTTGITYSAVSTANGYIVEARIPWTTLQGAATANKVIGIDFMINDDDDGSTRDGKLAWNAEIDNAWQDASLFGTAKLVDEVVTSLVDAEQMYMSVYPNPARGFIQIQGIQSTLDYSIIDNSGRQLESGRTNSSINVHHLESGVYGLILQNGQTKKVVRVVVGD